jgi:hypothetical protein
MEVVIREDKIMYVEMISCKAFFNVILFFHIPPCYPKVICKCN